LTFEDYQESKDKKKDKTEAPREAADMPSTMVGDGVHPEGELVRGKDDEDDEGGGAKKKTGKKKGNQGKTTVIRLRG